MKMEGETNEEVRGRKKIKTKVEIVSLVDSDHLHFPHTPGEETACGQDIDHEVAERETLHCDQNPSNIIGLCKDCLVQWESISQYVVPEETVDCSRCGDPTTVFDAKAVSHTDVETDVAVCSDCYESLKKDDSNNVHLPHSQTPSYADDRIFMRNYTVHHRNTDFL